MLQPQLRSSRTPRFKSRPRPTYLGHSASLFLAILLLANARAQPPGLETAPPADSVPNGTSPTLPAANGSLASPPTNPGKRLGCLRRFSPKNTHFNECKNRTCFIFLREEPYIRLDSRMTSDNHSVLFNCRTPNSKFSQLGGTAFKVIQRTAARDALCVWGGPDCLFNNMVDFIDETAKLYPDYRFAATGLLLENSDRVRKHIIPSVSLIKEELVIFGVDTAAITRRNPFPVDRLVHPFTYGAWGAFLVFSFLILMNVVFVAVAFGPRPMTRKAVVSFLMHEYPVVAVAETTPLPSVAESIDFSPEDVEKLFSNRVLKRLASYKVAKRLLRIALSATVIIFLLFYEIAVAQQVFFELKKPSLKDVRKLSAADLKHYSVEKDAATESVWNRTVFAPGKYVQYPWHRCKTNSDCFDMALNPKSPVNYVVGFKTAGTYQVLHRSTCGNMTVYGTENALYKFGAGWLYGSGVPLEYRRAIDLDILNVELSEELHEIAERDAGTLDTPECKTQIRDIDIGIVGAIVFILTLPTLLLIVFIIIFYCVKRFPQVIEEENQHQKQELVVTQLEKKNKLRKRRSSGSSEPSMLPIFFV